MSAPHLRWGVVALLLIATSAFAARYAGRPLVDALKDLEQQGLRLIYSGDVVRTDMIVKSEPRATQPREILDELLREHHLRAKAGPRGSLVIVREAEPEQTPAPRVVMPKTVEEIVVTPSSYTILAEEPERRQFLSRDEVRALPHLADDLYRAIVRVPGTTSSDVSARFNIRGGEEDEVVVLLDGMEVYDPFHVKDLFRAFSTIDAEAVGSVEILTGGFPVQYGGRMSGVIDIATLTPNEQVTEVGVSLLNTRVLSAGRFRNGEGEWLFSLRRGYLRELLKLIEDENQLDPTYYDLFAKVQLPLGEKTVASANVFASLDRLKIDEDIEDARAMYSDAYAWLNFRTSATPRLFTQNVLSYGQLRKRREGEYAVGIPGTSEEGILDEERLASTLAWRNDTSLDLSPRNTLKFGATIKRGSADYDYTAFGRILNSVFNVNLPPIEIRHQTDLAISGNDLSLYVADRARLTEKLVVEGGVRVDRQSWTPDGWHVGPRINAAYSVGEQTAIRAGWGRFYQPQRIDELQVEDGIEEFFPAQRSDHLLIGFDHRFVRGWEVRFEGYEKRMSDLRPRFENIYNRVVLFPELRPDRMRIAPESAMARGAEIIIRRDSDGPMSGWFSFAHARVNDQIDGRNVPRSWDQRQTLTASVNYRRGDYWNFNVSAVYHTGWPTTRTIGGFVDETFRVTLGPLNEERLPDYKRIDVRASRFVPVGRGGFSFFVEFFNAVNFHNVTRVESFEFRLRDGVVTSTPIYESIIGILPSFGVTWRW